MRSDTGRKSPEPRPSAVVRGVASHSRWTPPPLAMSLIVPSPSRILSLGLSVGQGAGLRVGWGLGSPPQPRRMAQGHDSAQPTKLTSPRTCLNSSTPPWQCGASLAQPQPPTLCLTPGSTHNGGNPASHHSSSPTKDPRPLSWAPRDPCRWGSAKEQGPTVECSQVTVPSQTGPQGPGGVVQPP